MKCPQCVKDNRESILFVKQASSFELGGATHFYDKDGVEHYHRPGHEKIYLLCSNNHWTVMYRAFKCGAAGCSFGHYEEIASNIELDRELGESKNARFTKTITSCDKTRTTLTS